MKRCYTCFPVRVLLLLVMGTMVGCASSREAARPALFGSWQYTMENPTQNTLTGQMTIQEAEEGAYTGHLTVQEMDINEPMVINTLDIEGDSFALQGRAAGYNFTMTGVVEDGMITGENDVQGVAIYSLRATRVAE